MKNIERTKDKNIDKILFTRNFYLICIANLCTCMAIYSVMPVLPLYLIDVLHCKESVMGIGLAAFPLIALAVRPFSGMMSDMMDCKRLLLIATTCCAIFFPLTYMAATISIFICIRLLHGVS
ncbi:MFS transporter, partial [Desulfovibrio piger]|uniref:MFS transporter n=2 Tax=Desulfovibrio TaxID=872 RepID=UPI0026ED6888